jgi:hypothetical protein
MACKSRKRKDLGEGKIQEINYPNWRVLILICLFKNSSIAVDSWFTNHN